MRNFQWAFLIFFSQHVWADKIQTPEMCFEKSVWPCLMSAEEPERLTKSNFKIFLSKEAVVKWLSVGDQIEVELLQGHLRLESKTPVRIITNGVVLDASFALISRSGIDLEVYETSSFKLRSYRLEKDNFIIRKDDFLSKIDLVKHARRYYAQPSELTQFLKQIETPWKEKFDEILAEQTKVIQRSVAALEEAERKQKAEAQQAQKEREKVRDHFFYRTFYR